MAFDTQEVCLDNHRRIEVRARGHNGVDYVDIGHDLRTITVQLLRRPPEELAATNIVIEEAGSKSRIKVTGLQFCYVDDPAQENSILLSIERPGGRSSYTLKSSSWMKKEFATDKPFHGFDPKYSRLQFHFSADTAIGMDCVQDSGDASVRHRRSTSTTWPRTTPRSGKRCWTGWRSSCPAGASCMRRMKGLR